MNKELKYDNNRNKDISNKLLSMREEIKVLEDRLEECHEKKLSLNKFNLDKLDVTDQENYGILSKVEELGWTPLYSQQFSPM